MVFPSYYNSRTTEANCDCDESDRLKEEVANLERQNKERTEQALEEARELREEERRSASSWREALDKQAFLYGKTANDYPSLNEEGVDEFLVA
jgi:F0F1-type ATP synthase membrane subunit b/b'